MITSVNEVASLRMEAGASLCWVPTFWTAVWIYPVRY